MKSNINYEKLEEALNSISLGKKYVDRIKDNVFDIKEILEESLGKDDEDIEELEEYGYDLMKLSNKFTGFINRIQDMHMSRPRKPEEVKDLKDPDKMKKTIEALEEEMASILDKSADLMDEVQNIVNISKFKTKLKNGNFDDKLFDFIDEFIDILDEAGEHMEKAFKDALKE